MSRVDIYGNGDVSLDLHSALLIYKNALESQVYVTKHSARVVDGVPTLMAARLARPLKTGERVRVQYSAAAQNVDAYLGDEIKPRAEIRVIEA